MEAHVAGFEEPRTEDPFLVDADDTMNPMVVVAIADRIRDRAR